MSEIPLPSVTAAWAGAGAVFLLGALFCAWRSCCGERIVMPRGSVQVSLLTAYLLVWLRLAIGWHFAVEGYRKVESVYRGPTETSRPWSSAGYLRESAGPLAPFFRDIAGDPDEQLLQLLAVTDPKADPPANRLSDPLNEQWENHFSRFAEHFRLEGDQRTKARDVFENHKNALGRWLVEGSKEVERYFPSGSVKVPMTTPERVALYRARVKELRDLLDKELPAFESDLGGSKAASLKAEVRRLRSELQADLDSQFAAMRSALENTLSGEQKAAGMPDQPSPSNWKLAVADGVMRWGLLVVGLCLLFGLLTRPAAWIGAVLLFLIYLAMPPLPGVPENPRAEGNYLFVDKNLIEILALLVIASTRSGEWFGLDGLLRFLNPFRGCRAGKPSNADAASSAS
ncbi:MAG: hypothetical protein NZM31_08105 [Gemmatales bacterium]|nr:hypothetical protein [Gemmatales bacterium]MDW8386955.1 hypothetical protein [Gemmatales bacterium]